jgi:hypothetical protein
MERQQQTGNCFLFSAQYTLPSFTLGIWRSACQAETEFQYDKIYKPILLFPNLCVFYSWRSQFRLIAIEKRKNILSIYFICINNIKIVAHLQTSILIGTQIFGSDNTSEFSLPAHRITA